MASFEEMHKRPSSCTNHLAASIFAMSGLRAIAAVGAARRTVVARDRIPSAELQIVQIRATLSQSEEASFNHGSGVSFSIEEEEVKVVTAAYRRDEATRSALIAAAAAAEDLARKKRLKDIEFQEKRAASMSKLPPPPPPQPAEIKRRSSFFQFQMVKSTSVPSLRMYRRASEPDVSAVSAALATATAASVSGSLAASRAAARMELSEVFEDRNSSVPTPPRFAAIVQRWEQPSSAA